MKQMNIYELQQCDYQGKIFETSLCYDKSSSAMFIKRFMNSKTCERFDSGTLMMESCSPEAIIDDINAEYDNKIYGKEKYHNEELYWIGYLLRYWVISYDVNSKFIYKNITANELRMVYLPYHCLDPQQAIERIIEDKKIKIGFSLDDAVKVMRKYLKIYEEN